MTNKKQNLHDKVLITFPQQVPQSLSEWQRAIKEFIKELKRELRDKCLRDFLSFVRPQKTNLTVNLIALIIIFLAIGFISFSLHQKNKNTLRAVAKLFIRDIEQKNAKKVSDLFVGEIKGEMGAHFSDLFKNSKVIDYFQTDYLVFEESATEAIVRIATDYQRKDNQGNIYRYLMSSGFEEFYDGKTGKWQRFKISSGRLIEEYLGFSPAASTYGMFTEVKLVREEGKWLIRRVR